MRVNRSFLRPDPIGGTQLPVQASEVARTAIAARGDVPPAGMTSAQLGRAMQGLPAGDGGSGVSASGFVPGKVGPGGGVPAYGQMASRVSGSNASPAPGSSPAPVAGARTGLVGGGGLYSVASGSSAAPSPPTPMMAGPRSMSGPGGNAAARSSAPRLAGWFRSR